MKGQFGVELESCGLSIKTLNDIIAVNGRRLIDNSHTHNGGTYFDGITWQSMADGSIKNMDDTRTKARWNNKGTHEVVSPVLKGNKGMKAVEEVVKAMTRAGAKVNRSCGLHVTYDCSNSRWTRMGANKKMNTLEEIADTYNWFGEVICSMLAPSRRFSSYAPIQSFNNMQNRGFPKYTAINMGKFARHGVIEFRQHQGTLNAKKLREWVNFCHRIICVAVNEEFKETHFSNYPKTFEGMCECLQLNEAQVRFWSKRIRTLNGVVA